MVIKQKEIERKLLNQYEKSGKSSKNLIDFYMRQRIHSYLDSYVRQQGNVLLST
jgi:hypothetical protein